MHRRGHLQRLPKTVDEVHEDLADYEIDALTNVEDYYKENPGYYDPEKIDALLGKSRDGRKEWTELYVSHAKLHIEILIGEREAEKQREAREAAIREAPFIERIMEERYAKFAIVMVTNQYGVASPRLQDPVTKRFVSLLKVKPEKVAHSEIDPRDLEWEEKK